MDVGMVFAIIFTAIVIVLVLTLGVDQIRDLLGIGRLAQINGAIKELRGVVDLTYTLSEGTVKPLTLRFPSGARFCFVDSESPEADLDYADRASRWDPDDFVVDEIRRKGYSLWVYSEAKDPGEGYAVDYLKPGRNFCAPGGSGLLLINRGLYVDVVGS
ncbi:MAG: hypothetical protein HY367_03210 [Candidatus Aenigmarchaeota archaeon]|nr:hypothetical protein [Candidatus Aenigmarchaeota archaeon]